ncbi:hypothetical protein Y032_0054g2498 [Ancylostoma ceylanicum]|uniref:Uncharacterized protein n=1 Tax=Ancylostoma ceylanicum TaxID=53326 RepID=A0A016U6A2_9BILA|nr:hypothetical protein Y032_0054g2498 [Ancylostoma ceylanicum]
MISVQRYSYSEFQTDEDKGWERDAGTLVVCCISRGSDVYFFSLSLPSLSAASVQQTTRVPAPRSRPLSTTVWSSLYCSDRRWPCPIHGLDKQAAQPRRVCRNRSRLLPLC